MGNVKYKGVWYSEQEYKKILLKKEKTTKNKKSYSQKVSEKSEKK